jgi:hypothetical protein
MKKSKITFIVLTLVIIACTFTGLTACNPSTPGTTTSPIPSSPTTLEPAVSAPAGITISPLNTTSAVPTPLLSPSGPAVSSTQTPDLTPVSSSSPAATAALPATTKPAIKTQPAEVSLASSKTTTRFPDSITFAVQGSSVLPVKSLTLEYGNNKRTLAETVNRVQLEVAPGTNINASYIWEMKKTGSLPPQAEVWYQWRVKDEEERVYVSTRQSMFFEDTRYQWQQLNTAELDLYYHDQELPIIKELLEGVQSNLARIQLNTTIPQDRKIKVLLYNDYTELRSSGLFYNEWMGGGAFPGYNIIIMVVNTESLSWAKGALPHEITHLIVGEAVFGPFGDIPTWLSEGLSSYSEGVMKAPDQKSLSQALQANKLLSMRSLSSSFPADSAQASLAYTESHSIVSYLIETYGWEKMRELLAVFKDGSTYDGALKKVYALDTAGLESAWKAYLAKV